MFTVAMMQVREVVAFAAERFIEVIPEIELPGHCCAALACYPNLSCETCLLVRTAQKFAWRGDVEIGEDVVDQILIWTEKPCMASFWILQ